MDSLNIFICLLLFCNFLRCWSLENKTKAIDITTNCFEPLGISDGRIEDYQLDVPSAYNNDFKTYGAQRARLNMTSWPPGYRSAPDKADSAWLKVELGHIMVITGIATQGYGDTSVSEWLESYILLYSQGGDDDFSNFMDTNGELQNFKGNYDSNSIQVNRVILPVKALSLTLMSFLLHNNFALRMELYGCRSDYYFVAWLMLAKTHFTIDSLAFRIDPDRWNTMVHDVEQQVTDLLKSTPGFLSIRVKRFSPQESEKSGALVTAEVEIECLRYSQPNLVTKLREEITSGATIFNSKYLEIQHTADEANLVVNVSLNLIKNLQGIKEVLPDESCTLEANVSSLSGAVNSSLEKYKFKWEMSTIDEDTGQFSPILELSDKERNITISSGHMPAGLTFVRVSVIMMPKETTGPVNYDFGFIRILPRLKVSVDGPVIVIKGGGPARLNSAIEGVLQVSFGHKAENVTYSWSCTAENFVSSNMTITEKYRIQNTTENTESRIQMNTTKCFHQEALYSARKRSLVFNPDLLISNRTYTFHVMAAQGRRCVIASHKLRVDTNISLLIKCVANCENKVSTRRKLVLKTQCTGISCSVLSVYRWSLFVRLDMVTHESWSKIDNLDHIALTSLDGPNLVIGGAETSKNHSSLLVKRTYKVRVIAWIDEEIFQPESFIFRTNLPPSKQGNNSGCFVEPRRGEAITTEFSVKCVNWIDSDWPLSYQFSYQTKFGVVVFHSGRQSNVTTDLPLGKPSKNYSLILQLEVIDSLGDSAVEFIGVEVRPPKASSMEDSKGKLDNLLDSGNVEKAMQLAFAVLSTAEGASDAQTNTVSSVIYGPDSHNENIVNTEKRRNLFKNALIDKMTDVEVGSMEQATLVVGVIAMATDNEEGISDDSQEKALNMLGNAANFVSSQISNGSTDPALVQSIGTSLFSGIGNVLSAASSKAGPDNEEADEEEEAEELKKDDKVDSEAAKEKSKKRAKNAVNLVSKVGDSLLATKAVGEKPTVFKTKSLDVLLDRQRGSDMGGKKLGEGPSGVALPSATSLFSGQEGEGAPEAVDSQMLSFNKNPFTWDKSAETVKSSVLDFKLKASGGKTMNISGLREPIELFIPISAKADEQAKSNNSEPKLFLKPSYGTSNIRFHRFSVSSHDVLVTITIRPERGKKVDVFVNYKTKPTPQEKVFSTTIPDLSSCSTIKGNSSESHNCSSDPFTFTFSSLVSGYTGFHYLGVRYVMENTEVDAKAGTQRTKRSCSPSHRRGKRSCVDVKDAPTTPAPTPLIIVPTYNSSTDVNYTLSISVSGCLYWSESKEKWTGEGCRVGPKTTSKQLQCLCTHLSAFGGDFFVAPNPIEFDKVFAAFGNLAETGNFVVLSTVCVILGLYAIGLVFARREDKQDELRVVANVNINENEGDNKYYISIQTGMWRGNGTSANVGLAIYGCDGSTGDISLTDPQLDKLFFSRGSINNFTLCLQEPLGSLEKIRIWHDNGGRNPSWFLMQVVIQDLSAGEKAHFIANRWIAVEKEDGKLELELSVAGKKELSRFRSLFYSRTATSLGEKHLWLSVLTRPPHNSFTRAQRLACCLSILFAAMVTNAMFYNFGTPPGDAVQVGPLKVTLTQIKIGIQSSIVAIPVNVLVVSIFRNLKPRSTPGDEETKTQGCLPHWFVFVAWFICTMATLTSAAFIVFYSLMWGADTSNEWLVSVMVSFFQDVIVMQPLKVLIVASILSVLIKKPPEQEEVVGESISGIQGGDVVPPNEKERERARKFRSSLVQVGHKVLEFVLFFIYILLMMVVCYSNRGVERVMVTQSMENLFESFSSVHNIPYFWKWSKNVLVPRLYDVDWYNGRPFEYEEGFLSNRAAFLVGMPRLRQLRVKSKKNCSIMASAPALARKFSRCLPLYRADVDYLSQYNRPGWYPIQNATQFYNDFELEKECPRPWRYRTAESLSLRPFGGVMATFGGGGYIADLGYNSRSALKVIKVLENDKWIDDRTVAVFIEFTIFEPTSSLFSSIKLLFERSPTGGSLATVMFKTLSLYAPPDPNSRSLFQVCQLLLMIMIIVFVFAEIGKLRQEKCLYFKQLWNWMELLQLCSTICALAFFFLKESKTSQFVKKLQENPFKTSSIDNIEFMSDLETYLLAFVIFIVTIKFLRLIKFNRHVCQVLGTLQRAATSVLSFMTVFVTIILAYTQVGFLVFSSDVIAYSSFYSSLRALLLMLFGGEMHFQKLQATSRFVAPAFLFSYLLTMFMVLLNMFLAILNDCYYEVKNVEPGEAFADAELGAFMVDYAKQKLTYYVDETVELVQGVFKSAARFFGKDKQQGNKDDLESFSDQAKLASFDSMGDIDDDNDKDDKPTDPLLTFKSLSSLDKYETMSLGDLKESIAQIGREMRQSLTSLKSATSRKSSYHQSAPYDFKRALARLEEDDGTLTFDSRSSYFSAFGSYLEDIWQKDRRSFQDLSREYRHRRRVRKSTNFRENQHMLGET